MTSKHKILSIAQALPLIEEAKMTGKKIVFTNGCFDILHIGHIYTLETAASHGDFMIVGVNDDQSVQKLKGSDRPILSQEERATLLAALECVDVVIIFNEDTPIQLITAIQPDVLVKGGDYSVDNMVGAEIVIQNEGEVICVPFQHGHSTTDIIAKIKNL